MSSVGQEYIASGASETEIRIGALRADDRRMTVFIMVKATSMRNYFANYAKIGQRRCSHTVNMRTPLKIRNYEKNG